MKNSGSILFLTCILIVLAIGGYYDNKSGSTENVTEITRGYETENTDNIVRNDMILNNNDYNYISPFIGMGITKK